MIDKNYCMSSYLALRYIEKDGVEFANGLHHQNFTPLYDAEQIAVRTSKEIDQAIAGQLRKVEDKRMGILLSGGMDSAIVASYVPGCDAYTFRFLNGTFQVEELRRAESYAEKYHLTLHYVDINWNTVVSFLEPVMWSKAAPVHSIEPQILQAALQAKADGIELMLIGNSSDYVFGGMDQLLSKEWSFDDFMKRYIYIQPADALNTPVDMTYLFEKYRRGNGIDFVHFMNTIAMEESYGSYWNAFQIAGLPYFDPYARLKMAEPLNLERIRNGESKYLIRELFTMRYPGFLIPEKIPMPRPVDTYFVNWTGPKRPEFRPDINIKHYSGDQKWLIWCLEKFLNMIESESKK